MRERQDWSFADLLNATHGKHCGGEPRPITGFSIDSRTLKNGEVFIAFKGERTDGHKYIKQAIEKGASAVVASHWIDNISAPNAEDPAWIKCENPLEALQSAARFHRKRHKGIFIGVTGSNGKTTTKEMLFHLFSSVSKSWATSGNFNNDIGLPLGLVNIPLDVENAIIEMGMNHAGELRFLADIAKPNAALITNIGPAHIGNLGSLENIASAKAEILENLGTDDIAVLPGDSTWLSTLKTRTKAKSVTFGFGMGCDYSGQNVIMEPQAILMDIIHGSEKAVLRLSLLGKHNASNALAALAVFIELRHINLNDAAKLLECFKPVTARMESHEIEDKRVILDCYNANPASMKHAIEYLSICKGRKIAVLGDMLELGTNSEALHRELGETIAKSGIDMLIAVGEQAQFIAQAALRAGMAPTSVYSCANTKDAAQTIEMLSLPGDTLLLKASRGMHFENIIKDLWPELHCDLH